MSDIDVVLELYTAMANRDLERIAELVDPSCVLTQDDRLPWGGRHVGHEGLATFAARLTGTIDSAVTTEAIFEADGEVIQCGRTRGTVVATGEPFDIAEVHRWTIREGRAVAAHFAIDTPAMLDALGSGA
jgi:ketosteroid isomerase-like protein